MLKSNVTAEVVLELVPANSGLRYNGLCVWIHGKQKERACCVVNSFVVSIVVRPAHIFGDEVLSFDWTFPIRKVGPISSLIEWKGKREFEEK